jgi:hypothetical protein
VTPFARVRSLPGIAQLTGVAALVVVGGPLAPWVEYDFHSPDNSGSEYISGVEFNAGELSLVIGALVIALLIARGGRLKGTDAGMIAALGLLAGALAAVTVIKYHGTAYSVAWGLWLSSGAALALLIAGLMLGGVGKQLLPPPD